MASKRDRRLRDWKEIAAFFGRDERTVRRWEQQRGLPVHRISGGARNLVFAYTDELERWLRGGETVLPDDVEPPPDEPVAPALVRVPATSASSTRIPAFSRLALLAIGAVALMVLAVAVTVTARGIDAPPARIAYRPDPKVQDLYLDAVYHLGTRQADGFTHAIQLLTEATTLDPNYADAYVKLAEAYNTISQFTLMPAMRPIRVPWRRRGGPSRSILTTRAPMPPLPSPPSTGPRISPNPGSCSNAPSNWIRMRRRRITGMP